MRWRATVGPSGLMRGEGRGFAGRRRRLHGRAVERAMWRRCCAGRWAVTWGRRFAVCSGSREWQNGSPLAERHLEMACDCDAGERRAWADVQRIGLPRPGGTIFLHRLAGPAKALELFWRAALLTRASASGWECSTRSCRSPRWRRARAGEHARRQTAWRSLSPMRRLRITRPPLPRG